MEIPTQRWREGANESHWNSISRGSVKSWNWARKGQSQNLEGITSQGWGGNSFSAAEEA